MMYIENILTDCYIFVFHDKVTKIRVYLTRRPRSSTKITLWWLLTNSLRLEILTMVMMMTIFDHHHYHRVGSKKILHSKILSMWQRHCGPTLFLILRSLLNCTYVLMGTKAKIMLKHIFREMDQYWSLSLCDVQRQKARADLTEIFLLGLFVAIIRLNS